jgi:hypothetical protein
MGGGSNGDEVADRIDAVPPAPFHHREELFFQELLR